MTMVSPPSMTLTYKIRFKLFYYSIWFYFLGQDGGKRTRVKETNKTNYEDGRTLEQA